MKNSDSDNMTLPDALQNWNLPECNIFDTLIFEIKFQAKYVMQ